MTPLLESHGLRKPPLHVPLFVSKPDLPLIKRTWDLLNLTTAPSVGASHSSSRHSTCSLNASVFQHILCGNILKYENNLRHQINTHSLVDYDNVHMLLLDLDIEAHEVALIRESYQTDSIVQLISLYVLHKQLEAASLVVDRFAKIHRRVWDISLFQYVIMGESLILLLIEILGRLQFPTETEAAWLRFWNGLLAHLLSRATDPTLDIPIINTSTSNNLGIDPAQALLSNLKINSQTTTSLFNRNSVAPTHARRMSMVSLDRQVSDDSSKSDLVLSLQDPDTDTSSVVTVHQLPEAEKHTIDAIEEHDDDDAYDYLNSFEETASPKKPARKKSLVLDPRLSRTLTKDKRASKADNCTIM